MGERGEPVSNEQVGWWPGVEVPVFAVTGSQDTPIERILRAYGEGSRGDVRGTFVVGERKLLSATLNSIL